MFELDESMKDIIGTKTKQPISINTIYNNLKCCDKILPM